MPCDSFGNQHSDTWESFVALFLCFLHWHKNGLKLVGTAEARVPQVS